jgi:peptide/nickel transport system substrate-binding protein
MREFGWLRALAVLAAALALLLAGCGGDDEPSGEESTQGDTAPQEGAQKGGDLTVLYAGDVDFIDPGQTYYQYGFLVAYATQRPLYSFKPDDASTPEPDLAEGPPEISADGKTVTVKIRPGVKFSPPVNREVTSDDVAYAIQRGFTEQVSGGYVGAYLGDLTGLEAFQDGKADSIKGITTPDDQTIVFELDRPRGAIVAGALALPASAPVPRDYAKEFDSKSPSAYGQHQVATGPYMIENDESGKLTGYSPGSEIRLVRNPNWDASTDYKPAYLDSITIREGAEPQVASRQILEGDAMVSGDFQLPASVLARTSRGDQKEQLVLTPPTGRYRYIALNTRVEPFDNPDVRRAIVAAFDREALRQAFGGPLTGDIPTHIIPPGQPGHEEAGGSEGPGLDFMANPKGDLELAKEYMRKAGFESGMYDGDKVFTSVSDNATQQRQMSEVAVQQFAKLGFEVDTNYVVRDSMYTKFCMVPGNQPDICPSVGWLKDFADAETLLNPVFNGKNILDQSNSNFSLLDEPELNQRMDEAETLNDPEERNAAWGEIDAAISEQAPGILWLWDKQPMLRSENVNGVVNVANASWDLTFTSLR